MKAKLTLSFGCLDIRVDTTGPLPFLLLLSEDNVFILSNNKLFYLWNKMSVANVWLIFRLRALMIIINLVIAFQTKMCAL